MMYIIYKAVCESGMLIICFCFLVLKGYFVKAQSLLHSTSDAYAINNIHFIHNRMHSIYADNIYSIREHILAIAISVP